MVTRATLVSLSMQVTRVGASERPAPLEGGHLGSRRAGGPRSTPACPVSVSVQRGACAVVPVALDVGNSCFPTGASFRVSGPCGILQVMAGLARAEPQVPSDSGFRSRPAAEGCGCAPRGPRWGRRRRA